MCRPALLQSCNPRTYSAAIGELEGIRVLVQSNLEVDGFVVAARPTCAPFDFEGAIGSSAGQGCEYSARTTIARNARFAPACIKDVTPIWHHSRAELRVGRRAALVRVNGCHELQIAQRGRVGGGVGLSVIGERER